MDKFWPLIEWDVNEICWILYAKRFIIHLLPRSMFTKKWKNLRSYKTPHFLTLNLYVAQHITLDFCYWHSLVWNLDFEWLNFGVRWLQLGVSAKDLLIIVTSMSARKGFVSNLQWCPLIPHHRDLDHVHLPLHLVFHSWFILALNFYWFVTLIMFVLLYFLVLSSNVSF